MLATLDDLITQQAQRTPESPALRLKDTTLSYRELNEAIDRAASAFIAAGIKSNDRVAVYLPKTLEAVITLFAASRASAVFVPINPLLKPAQVSYILNDCHVRLVVTSSDRTHLLKDVINTCPYLSDIVLTDSKPGPEVASVCFTTWSTFSETPKAQFPKRIDSDLAAILYTSGSTGNPKGVVLTHRNMLTGAQSVASYLKNTSDDVLLAVLPLSFDYGLSQLTTAFHVGASVVLMDYLLPRDVIKAVSRYSITGLAGVPPLWNQLAQLDWPEETRRTLRYITNSGGAMPVSTTKLFREKLPTTEIYLMYGLTEAFRSTFLPPEEVDLRPESMGKAIPNAEVLVLREDGSECDIDEPGELVHRGPLVSLGYWNDPAKTAVRFKPIPTGGCTEVPLTEIAVWSGDRVKKDKDGYLYFISRADEMIKTSGYRVSPTEVEEVVYASGLAKELVAIGAKHPQLGEAIILILVTDTEIETSEFVRYFQRNLPAYMHPKHYVNVTELPRNQNGKIDRKMLAEQYSNHFMELES